MNLAAVLLLSISALLASCTLTATAYPVDGPAAKSGEVLAAKFFYGGRGSGRVTVTMADGERCEGRYATVIGGVVSPLAAENAPPGLARQVSNGFPVGLQTSRAMLLGNRGTVIDFEGYTSGANPRHGFGLARDNKGSTWKLIW